MKTIALTEEEAAELVAVIGDHPAVEYGDPEHPLVSALGRIKGADASTYTSQQVARWLAGFMPAAEGTQWESAVATALAMVSDEHEGIEAVANREKCQACTLPMEA